MIEENLITQNKKPRSHRDQGLCGMYSLFEFGGA